MLDRLRTQIHSVITSPRGDRFGALRVPKDLARRLNVTFGSPLCSPAELARRKEAVSRLGALRRGDTAAAAPAAKKSKVPAPITVYFDRQRNARLVARVEELLKSKELPFTKLDVAGDEATMTFVTRKAACEEDDLPVVFVGDQVVGAYDDLVRADVSGDLARMLEA